MGLVLGTILWYDSLNTLIHIGIGVTVFIARLD